MDLNEDIIKEEVSNFVSSLQKMLPKKKEIINVLRPQPKMCRLTDVHADTKNVFPKCFVGAKLVILREIMDRVKLSQQYNYGTMKKPYSCFNHLLYKELEPKVAGQTLVVDTSASATATYRQDLDDGYEMLLTSKIRDLYSSETELIFEKKDRNYYGAVTCAMRDVDPATLKVVSQWMHRVLPDFSVGLEVGFKPFSHPPFPEFSVSGKYEKTAFTLSSTVSKMGFQVCCFKKFSEDVRVGAVINESNEDSPSMSLAVHKIFANSSEVKMFIDSHRCGGVTYQKEVYFRENINDLRVLKITVCSLIDKQRPIKFGIGFNIDL